MYGRRVLELHPNPDLCRWFPGARLNAAAAALTCPRALPGLPALVWAEEGQPTRLQQLSLSELKDSAELVALCLSKLFKPGKQAGTRNPRPWNPKTLGGGGNPRPWNPKTLGRGGGAHYTPSLPVATACYCLSLPATACA